MKYFILISTFFTFLSVAQAKFEVQTSTGYSSNTDGKSKNSFSDITNHFFIGASFDSKEKFVVGQNISIVSTQYKTATTDKLSTTELGPRLNYYINNERNYFVTLAWNPFAKGKRTVAGIAEDISGWSYLAALGAVLKMGNSFYLGASLNYHSLSITKSIVGSTVTTVTDSYSSIMPMLNISFRFR